MTNPYVVSTLTTLIDSWAEKNAEEEWWQNNMGWWTPNTSQQLAEIVALVLASHADQADFSEEEDIK